MELPDNENLTALVTTLCDERKRAITSRKEYDFIWKAARDQYKGRDAATKVSEYEKGELLDSSLQRHKGDTSADRKYHPSVYKRRHGEGGGYFVAYGKDAVCS